MANDDDDDDGGMFDDDLMQELGLDEEDVKTTPRPGSGKMAAPLGAGTSGVAAKPGAPSGTAVPGPAHPVAKASAPSGAAVPQGPALAGAVTGPGQAASASRRAANPRAPIGNPIASSRAPAAPSIPPISRASAAAVPLGAEAAAAHPEPADLSEHNLNVSQDIPVQLAVVLAKQALKLQDILALKIGDVMDFKKAPQDPIDLVANGKLVAKAELVMVDGKMGVRILKLVK